jgi:hypothetical protein
MHYSMRLSIYKYVKIPWPHLLSTAHLVLLCPPQ